MCYPLMTLWGGGGGVARMNSEDCRKVWIYALSAICAVALAIIGIFTVATTVGGSNNTCHEAVCGDDNVHNDVESARGAGR